MDGGYFLDQSDCGIYLIRKNEERYLAGYNKEVVKKLINRLNLSYRPNIEVIDNNLYVCWNEHEKGDKCDFKLEIKNVCNDIAVKWMGK